jgi:hypothetical protein
MIINRIRDALGGGTEGDNNGVEEPTLKGDSDYIQRNCEGLNGENKTGNASIKQKDVKGDRSPPLNNRYLTHQPKSMDEGMSNNESISPEEKPEMYDSIVNGSHYDDDESKADIPSEAYDENPFEFLLEVSGQRSPNISIEFNDSDSLTSHTPSNGRNSPTSSVDLGNNRDSPTSSIEIIPPERQDARSLL